MLPLRTRCQLWSQTPDPISGIGLAAGLGCGVGGVVGFGVWGWWCRRVGCGVGGVVGLGVWGWEVPAAIRGAPVSGAVVTAPAARFDLWVSRGPLIGLGPGLSGGLGLQQSGRHGLRCGFGRRCGRRCGLDERGCSGRRGGRGGGWHWIGGSVAAACGEERNRRDGGKNRAREGSEVVSHDQESPKRPRHRRRRDRRHATLRPGGLNSLRFVHRWLVVHEDVPAGFAPLPLPFVKAQRHSCTTLSFSGWSPTRQLLEGRSLSELLMASHRSIAAS